MGGALGPRRRRGVRRRRGAGGGRRGHRRPSGRKTCIRSAPLGCAISIQLLRPFRSAPGARAFVGQDFSLGLRPVLLMPALGPAQSLPDPIGAASDPLVAIVIHSTTSFFSIRAIMTHSFGLALRFAPANVNVL